MTVPDFLHPPLSSGTNSANLGDDLRQCDNLTVSVGCPLGGHSNVLSGNGSLAEEHGPEGVQAARALPGLRRNPRALPAKVAAVVLARERLVWLNPSTQSTPLAHAT